MTLSHWMIGSVSFRKKGGVKGVDKDFTRALQYIGVVW